ncbi:AsmA family protein [Ramlibacter sp. PS4R-6]|uniref:AsmA family protein n=1 Tax=Ramlibacter sp. PS4R-6 TaxID=3133438 RepID=UPI003095B7B8
MDHAARHPLWAKLLVAFAVLVAALALLLVFFPWDTLREPVNRYVSEKTGRHFAITRKLDVKLGRTTRILADGIEFANPEWAKDPFLVKAEGGEVHIRLWPLIAHRQFVMPLVELRKPQLGLQLEPDGKRSWALGRDTGDKANVPDIGALVVDEGTLHFVAPAHKADIATEFVIDGPLTLRDTTTPDGQARPALPLRFSAKGTWQGEAFSAKGRTGNVLYLSAPLQHPFPMEIDAVAGATKLAARGEIASLATLDGANATVNLQGRNLAELYKLLGVVLPETPQYAVQGHVTKRGEVWDVQDIKGRLGHSDVAGRLAYDKQKDVPHLVGALRSNLLDFNDLAPLVGLQDKPRGPKVDQVEDAQAKAETGNPRAKAKKPPRDPNRKVLPTATLDLARLKAMNSDVHFVAAKVTNVQHLPLDRFDLRVRLQDGVLNLDPMKLGVAGGTLNGALRIDSHANPAVTEVKLHARGLELQKLVRDAEIIKGSFGKIHGDIELKGRGNSAAQMLGSSTGNVALLMGKGQISNLLLELVGLDGREILKFLMGGDRDVGLRCAATSFDVKDGLMTSRAVVLDTTDTIVYGKGSVSFQSEELDMWLHPYPKDKSILSLRSPINIGGTLGAPKVSPDKKALLARGAAAVALGAINPLLALAATIETGPGEDADCGAILKEAANPNSPMRGATEAMRRQQEEAQKLGGPRGFLGALRKDKPTAEEPALPKGQ